MAIIHTCDCGARVRLPEVTPGQTFRCPKCKSPINLSVARVEAAAHANPAGVGLGVTCPICQTEVTDADAVQSCPSCHQTHHRECWDEVGGCSTYGCEYAPEQETAGRSRRPLTAWGDTKICPECGETIKSIALRCRYCDAEFDTVDPMTRRDLQRAERLRREAGSMKTWVILCLAATPCLAPVTLIFALAVLIPKRDLLWRAGPTYPMLAYASAILSAVVCVVIVLVLALGE